MTLVMPSLKRFKLKEYNSNFPIVFVEANSPDDACFKAIYSLVSILLKQDDSVHIRILCRQIKHDIRIIKVRAE
jgi:hypothetical protein